MGPRERSKTGTRSTRHPCNPTGSVGIRCAEVRTGHDDALTLSVVCRTARLTHARTYFQDGNLFGAAPNVFISRVPPAADALRSLVLYPSPEDSEWRLDWWTGVGECCSRASAQVLSAILSCSRTWVTLIRSAAHCMHVCWIWKHPGVFDEHNCCWQALTPHLPACACVYGCRRADLLRPGLQPPAPRRLLHPGHVLPYPRPAAAQPSLAPQLSATRHPPRVAPAPPHPSPQAAAQVNGQSALRPVGT